MRLFVSIPLPPNAIVLVRRFIDASRDAFPGWDWSEPSQLHITLKFIGEVDDVTIAAARKAVGSVVTGGPFQLKFGKTTQLGPKENPTVLALKLTGETDRLVEIVRKLEDAFAKLGFDREARPFLPHVTIARRASDTPPGKPARDINGPSKWFGVSSVRLMKSTLTPDGAIHETVLNLPMLDRDDL